METKELFTVTSRVPREIYATLKAKALMDDASMNDTIADLLKDTVKSVQKRINDDIKKIQDVASLFSGTYSPLEDNSTDDKPKKPDHRRRLTKRRNNPRITDEIGAYIIETYLAHPRWTTRRVGLACGGYSPGSVCKVVKQYREILLKHGITLHTLKELPLEYRKYSILVRDSKEHTKAVANGVISAD